MREIPRMCTRCGFAAGREAVAKMRADDAEILLLRDEIASARCEIERLRLELITRSGGEEEVIYGVEA